MISAIIVAAGSSARFGKQNKLMLPFGALTVVEAAALPFVNNQSIDEIIVVINADSREWYTDIFGKYNSVKPIKFVDGGLTRTESVRNALKTITDSEYVLIHDGARPNVTTQLIDRVIEKTMESGACVPVVAMRESIRNEDGALERAWFCTAQTPQGFDSLKLKFAYDSSFGEHDDDASVYESMFGICDTVEGDVDNAKLTYPSDYYGLPPREMLVGVGYDVHCVREGRKLILGGEEIPYDKGLDSHSDADVLIHALMDAMLTAVAEGDIGRHFPVNDPQYEGISSMYLLSKVQEIIVNKGYSVNNVAAMIMAEAPILSPHIPKMSSNIAKILNIDAGKVGIAATTTEGLGIVGEGKGIAAYCAVTLAR